MVQSIGTPIKRRDAVAKVMGAARYAADFPGGGMTYAALATSTVARGRITSLDTRGAEAVPGVQLVLTHRNLNPLGSTRRLGEDQFVFMGGSSQTSFNPLSSEEVRYAGQIIAVVVADSVEAAEEGAQHVAATYAPAKADAALGGPGQTPVPFMDGKMDLSVGDTAAALASAPVKVEAMYETPAQHHNPIELYATVAAWHDGKLDVQMPSQWVIGSRTGLAAIFGLEPEDVHVVCPYVGGGFGGKAFVMPHTYLVAEAARRLGRPVKLVVPREQMFTVASFRPATIQKVSLGADRNGKLLAYAHDTVWQTSRSDAVAFPGSETTTRLYACPNISTHDSTVPLDTNTPGPMRAPAETHSFFALESAVDELAAKLGMDPVELRLRNEPNRDPVKGVPYSSRNLVQCFRRGAELIGWPRRDPRPGSMRHADGALLGLGCATAAYGVYLMPSTARVRLGAGGRARVWVAAHDLGTGAYTVLAQIAADALGLPVEQVQVELGDSNLPVGPVAGGSVTTGSAGSAIHATCLDLHKALLAASVAESGPFAGANPGALRVEAGLVVAPDGTAKPIAEVLGSIPAGCLEASGSWGPSGFDPAKLRAGLAGALAQQPPVTDTHAMFSFGAQFVEVRVDPVTAVPRISGLVGVFDCGRVVNPRTARSNLVGGMIWGASAALMEQTEVDREKARFVNTDLGGYHFMAHADVPPLVLCETVDGFDPVANPLGTKCVGELGIVGMNAAVANAVFHATGVRVRKTPIQVNDLVEGLPGRTT